MKTLTELLIVVAVIAVVVALFAWAAAPTLRRKFKRTLQLLPLVFGHWDRVMRTGDRCFANIGEGTHEDGIKSYIPDAGTNSRYLMYKIGSTADNCALTGAGDIPLGSSDDQADANNLDLPIAIKLFGAVKGTTRIITDGTLVNGSKVTTGANGQGTAAVTTNLVVGVAIIPSDTVVVAGDPVEMIPCLPLKAPF